MHHQKKREPIGRHWLHNWQQLATVAAATITRTILIVPHIPPISHPPPVPLVYLLSAARFMGMVAFIILVPLAVYRYTKCQNTNFEPFDTHNMMSLQIFIRKNVDAHTVYRFSVKQSRLANS